MRIKVNFGKEVILIFTTIFKNDLEQQTMQNRYTHQINK